MFPPGLAYFGVVTPVALPVPFCLPQSSGMEKYISYLKSENILANLVSLPLPPKMGVANREDYRPDALCRGWGSQPWPQILIA